MVAFTNGHADSGVFEAMAEFVEHRDHNGLYLVRINIENPALYNRYMSMLTGKSTVKESDLSDYRSMHIKDVPYDALDRYSRTEDNAIAVTKEGFVMDDHRIGRFSIPEFVCEEARSGAGHIAMATLSLFPGVATYVCSAEKATVKKFRHGKIDKKYQK